ncbi:hypothetical protein Tco_0687525 [Tanacetum coccineum]
MEPKVGRWPEIIDWIVERHINTRGGLSKKHIDMRSGLLKGVRLQERHMINLEVVAWVLLVKLIDVSRSFAEVRNYKFKTNKEMANGQRPENDRNIEGSPCSAEGPSQGSIFS